MTAAIDITTEQRRMLLALLRQFIPDVEVWAYGSRVKWTSHPGSDLDLVVFTTQDQRRRVSELKDALADSNLPFVVGVHVWAEEPERFQEIIRKEYVVLQSDQETHLDRRNARNGWPVVPLGELTENFDSRRVPVKELDRKPGLYPYYGASGIVDHIDSYLFDGEYLLIGEDGENLRTRQTPVAFVATGKFWVNNHAHIVRGNHRADTRFLSYVLSQTDISGYLTGSTMPKLTQGNLNRLPVIAPPLAEQRAIAAVLGALDDKIELNRRMNATLEAMARALFQSWFVDFDPVRAKLDGRHSAGLDPDTVALFPASFQDSSLGQIPNGWEAGSILQQANLLSGGTPKTDVPAYWNGDVPWASAKDVSQCGEAFLVSTERTITNLGIAESSTKIIPAFATIVVARGATTGRLTMFGHSMAMNQTCYGLRSKVGAPFALYCNVRHFIERLVQGGHGSIFDTITTSTFEATDVLLAPEEVLLAFDKQVTPLFHQIRANLHQSRTLATLRDTLLPKLLSGELRAVVP